MKKFCSIMLLFCVGVMAGAILIQPDPSQQKAAAQAPAPKLDPVPKEAPPMGKAVHVKGINTATGKPFPRGAKPTPAHKLFAAPKHHILKATPSQIAFVPAKLSYWLNNVDGDCVTAEEAFKCAAQNPEIFIEDSTVKTWASENGVLNGADLQDVMQKMAKSGFKQGGHTIGDGPFTTVDYSNEANLQNALGTGPVKIAIDANALPAGAGNEMGWYARGGSQTYNNTDHCVSIAGFGPAQWLFQQLNAPLPSAFTANEVVYLLFTWNTIGVVDHKWIMSTTTEAYLRNPCTIVDGAPLPNPGTGTGVPTITSAMTASGAVGQSFTYQIAATNSPTSYVATNVPIGLTFSTSTGTITGIPTVAGTTTIAIGATNPSGTGTGTLALTVSGSVPTNAPVITSPLTVAGLTGQPLSYTITATNNPTSFSVTNPPHGMTISGAVISGTPKRAGTHSYTVSAQNASGPGSAVVTLTVTAKPPTPAGLMGFDVANKLIIGAPDDYTIPGEIRIKIGKMTSAQQAALKAFAETFQGEPKPRPFFDKMEDFPPRRMPKGN